MGQGEWVQVRLSDTRPRQPRDNVFIRTIGPLFVRGAGTLELGGVYTTRMLFSGPRAVLLSAAIIPVLSCPLAIFGPHLRWLILRRMDPAGRVGTVRGARRGERVKVDAQSGTTAASGTR